MSIKRRIDQVEAGIQAAWWAEWQPVKEEAVQILKADVTPQARAAFAWCKANKKDPEAWRACQEETVPQLGLATDGWAAFAGAIMRLSTTAPDLALRPPALTVPGEPEGAWPELLRLAEEASERGRLAHRILTVLAFARALRNQRTV